MPENTIECSKDNGAVNEGVLYLCEYMEEFQKIKELVQNPVITILCSAHSHLPRSSFNYDDWINKPIQSGESILPTDPRML